MASSCGPGPSTAAWAWSSDHTHGACVQVSCPHRVSYHVTPAEALWSHCTLDPKKKKTNVRDEVECRATHAESERSSIAGVLVSTIVLYWAVFFWKLVQYKCLSSMRKGMMCLSNNVLTNVVTMDIAITGCNKEQCKRQDKYIVVGRNALWADGWGQESIMANQLLTSPLKAASER